MVRRGVCQRMGGSSQAEGAVSAGPTHTPPAAGLTHGRVAPSEQHADRSVLSAATATILAADPLHAADSFVRRTAVHARDRAVTAMAGSNRNQPDPSRKPLCLAAWQLRAEPSTLRLLFLQVPCQVLGLLGHLQV